MEITRRSIETSHKSEGPKHDPYSVDIYTVETNDIQVKLRCGSLGYERLTVLDIKRGWVLEEFEIYVDLFSSSECRGEHESCTGCDTYLNEQEMDRHLEYWTGLNRRQLFRISQKLERMREAADPFHGFDPFYGHA